MLSPTKDKLQKQDSKTKLVDKRPILMTRRQLTDPFGSDEEDDHPDNEECIEIQSCGDQHILSFKNNPPSTLALQNTNEPKNFSSGDTIVDNRNEESNPNSPVNNLPKNVSKKKFILVKLTKVLFDLPNFWLQWDLRRCVAN